jgi:hypothetical protein
MGWVSTLRNFEFVAKALVNFGAAMQATPAAALKQVGDLNDFTNLVAAVVWPQSFCSRSP